MRDRGASTRSESDKVLGRRKGVLDLCTCKADSSVGRGDGKGILLHSNSESIEREGGVDAYWERGEGRARVRIELELIRASVGHCGGNAKVVDVANIGRACR